MQKIEKALQLKSELDKLRPISAEQEDKIMQKFRLDWNYHSNHLEGNSLTYGETRNFLMYGVTASGKPFKDYLEIEGHNHAIKLVEEVIKQQRPLTEDFIRDIHTLILKKPYQTDAITIDGKPTKKNIEIGKYKTSDNHLKTITGEIFYFATAQETPAKMNDLMLWYKEEIGYSSVNPIILSAEFHYKFVRIHPFDDGNGRIARILMNFILMQFSFPPAIIKSEDKENYFYTLRQADSGDIEPFIDYITENVSHSLEIMIKGAKGEEIDDLIDYSRKTAALLKQKLKAKESQNAVNSEMKEKILNIYDNSVTKFWNKMNATYKNYDQFYVTKKVSLIIGDTNPVDSIEEGRRKINDIQEEIKIHIYYEIPRGELKLAKFFSTFIFKFYQKEYTLGSSLSRTTIKKQYQHQLEEHEINEIIKEELDRFKEMIDQSSNVIS